MPSTLSLGFDQTDVLATSPTPYETPQPTIHVLRNVTLTPNIPPFDREKTYKLSNGPYTPDISVKFKQMTGRPANNNVCIYVYQI